MPELMRFGKLIFEIFFERTGRHHTPHIHVRHAEHTVSIDFDGIVLDGNLPPKLLKKVRRWIAVHKGELNDAWAHATGDGEVSKIKKMFGKRGL